MKREEEREREREREREPLKKSQASNVRQRQRQRERVCVECSSSTVDVNHRIIGFMSVARVKIIANVPRVTSGKVLNGAIHETLIAIHGTYPGLFLMGVLPPLVNVAESARLWRELQSMPLGARVRDEERESDRGR